METKLTLKLDKTIINHAKIYAKQKNLSLSKMVEKFFRSLTDDTIKKEERLTPLIKELSGIIKLDSGFDFKEEYTHHLIEKYK